MNHLAIAVTAASVQAALFDATTGQLQGNIITTPFQADQPAADAVEIGLEPLWDLVTRTARAAALPAGLQTQDEVVGIGLTTMSPALVLLDQKQRPLAPLWLPADRRVRTVGRQVWGEVGQEFLTSVGHRPVPGTISVLEFRHLLGLDPYLLHRMGNYLHLNGWLAFRLTGVPCFDYANAGLTGLFAAMTNRRWSPRWCDFFEVDPHWLPEATCGTRTIGHLTSAMAATLGVPAGIPVKVGTDELGSLLLAADLRPGDLLQIVDTTQTLATLTDRPTPSPQCGTRPLGVGETFVQVSHNPVGPAALAWMHRLCFSEQAEAEFYDRTIPQALARQSLASFDPPFLAGDVDSIETCRASFRDLTLTTDRHEFVAALIQALLRRQRQALAALEVVNPQGRIVLTGPGANLMGRLLSEFHEARIEIRPIEPILGIPKLFALESPRILGQK